MTKRTEAREKIRNHLDARSNHSVVVTERMARYWWRVCNVALFQNKLYPPAIVIKSLKENWGYCEVSEDITTVALASQIGTRSLFLCTLLHEMVHTWEQQTYSRMGHGKRFLQWRDRILNEVGLDIHLDLDDEDISYGEKLYKRRY